MLKQTKKHYKKTINSTFTLHSYILMQQFTQKFCQCVLYLKLWVTYAVSFAQRMLKSEWKEWLGGCIPFLNSILACQQHFPPNMAVTFAYHYTSNMHATIQHVPPFTHPSIYTLNYSRRGAADANVVDILISVSSGRSSPRGWQR